MNVRRGTLVDLYVEDHRSVAMVGEQVIVLSEVATAIVAAVPPGQDVTVEQVIASVLAEFGEPDPPATAADLTVENIHSLAAHQVLAIEGDTLSAPERTTPRATRVLMDALRVVLTPSGVQEVEWSFPSDLPQGEFLAALRRHRVGSQLVTGMDRLDFPEPLRSHVVAEAQSMRAACRPLIADLHRALDVLREAQVRAITFKGVALARQAWDDEYARGFGDHDLLVHPAQLERAYAALNAAGWQGVAGYPVPGTSWAWQHFVRTSNELPLTRPRSTVDLHWYLVPARATFPSFDVLWSRHVTVPVGGREVATLSAYDALTHSASHAAKDQWRWMRGLADVHRLIASPATWSCPDRPLRNDQLATVGLAGRMFGIPANSPLVAYRAMESVEPLWQSVLTSQAGPEYVVASTRVPGQGAARTWRTLELTNATPADRLRELWALLLPPWATAAEKSSVAVVGLPRALARRATEVVPLWKRAAGRTLAQRRVNRHRGADGGVSTAGRRSGEPGRDRRRPPAAGHPRAGACC